MATNSFDEKAVAKMIEKIRAHVRKQGYHIVGAAPGEETRAKYSKSGAMLPITRHVGSSRSRRA